MVHQNATNNNYTKKLYTETSQIGIYLWLLKRNE